MANQTPSILSLFKLTDEQRVATTAGDPAISVTAGAGSGKTQTLVGRYLVLLERGVPLRSLVAITFTEKAAREMRNRVRANITRWLEQVPAAERELWQEAFSVLDAARISTIHGLCTAILRTHPVEASLDPAFDVLDEGQSALWQARAVEAALVWATTDSDVARLFGFFQEAQLRHLLAELLEKCLDAEQALAHLPDNPAELWSAALDRWLTEQLTWPAWSESLQTLAGMRAKKSDDKLEIARQAVLAGWDEIRRAQANQDRNTVFGAFLVLRAAISSGGQQGNWDADDLAGARQAMRALRTHFDGVIGQLVDKKKPPDWTLDQRAAEILPLVRRLFEQTHAIYEGYKSEANVLDFDDLEQITAQLLVTNIAVRARWQREIQAMLLVDEFQDTNHRQREIVYALAGFGPGNGRREAEGHGSRGGRANDSDLPSSQPANSSAKKLSPQSFLFIVGDAKQSIYRFRGADVAVFRQVQEDIRAAGGALINFDLTFRAHQNLVELTNHLLAPLMPAKDDSARPYDVPFAPLTAHRSEPRPGIKPPYLEFQLGLGQDKQAGRQAAAAALAGRLQDLQHAGQIEWQDVALLFRASTAFGLYEDALEQAGIPFVTIAGRGFYERPEVRDLLNALAAVADPGDDLAMAGLLRSPAIGLSDAALYLLRWNEPQRRRSFWLALQSLSDVEGLSDDDRRQAEFALQLITKLHEQAGRVSVAQLLKAFLDATQYLAVLRLSPGGERLRRNVDKLLVDAHRSELVNVTEFLEYIAALGDIGARESEAPTEAGGAVQLMTIHKAKGLEFPLVVLADAGYTGGFRSALFHLDQELGLVLNLSDGEAQPAAFRLAACRAADQEAAEERRLLYVAATRAMEKFIISGDAKLSQARARPGRLLLSGWLAQLGGVVGLSELQLSTMPTSPQSVSLEWGGEAVTCTIYPPVEATAAVSSTEVNLPGPEAPPVQLPDLLPPLTVAPEAEVDEKLQARESDPPPRVWRVVPKTKYEVPAWVVGSLTHIALRHWRFPENEPEGETTFVKFLRPFALEAGLTDPASIDIALTRVIRLLTRFRVHPLYTQLSNAQRHHEVPYTLTVDGQLRSGIIDLLFRTSPEAAWTIAEFKTDRLPAGANLRKHVQQKGYDRQVRAYRQAVAQQLGATQKTLLVFLNAGQSVQVLRVET